MRISDWSSDVCSDLPPPGHAEQPQGFWQHRLFLAAIVLMAAVPLLWPDVPPLTDLPGHMGRYRVQLDLVDSPAWQRSEEHTSELQSLMRISYAVFCLKKKT